MRGRGLAVAGTVVALVGLVVLAAVWFLQTPTRGEADAPASSANPAPTVADPTAAQPGGWPTPTGEDVPPTDLSASACGLRGSLVDADATLAWAPDAATGMLLPVSSTDGPRSRPAGGPWSCYADTNIGAVMAGFTIGYRTLWAADWRSVVSTQTVGTQGQAVLLGSVPNEADSHLLLRGYTGGVTYTGGASVTYWLTGDLGEETCTVELVWSAGDWRVKLREDGRWSTCVAGSAAGLGYTVWTPR